MLKLKNSIFLFFGVFIVFGFLYVYSERQAVSYAENASLPENGRVLGVSEEVPEDKTEAKKYIALDEIEKVVPVVDKSIFAPLKKEGAIDPKLGGGSIVALDTGSGKVLYEKGGDKQRPIASITKLATALVLMDLGLDWDQYYDVKESDRIEGGRIYVKTGESIKIKDLLYTSLVASDNTAARALVSASGLSYEDFIKTMNKKAADLGLAKTKFVDPVGISSLNVSTALEIAKLAQAAVSNGVIRDCLLKPKYVFSSKSGVTKTVNSTDILLDDFQDGGVKILGGKTGYTAAAGYCFTAMFDSIDGSKIVTAVLGSEGSTTRFTDTKKLLGWAYSNYEWRR